MTTNAYIKNKYHDDTRSDDKELVGNFNKYKKISDISEEFDNSIKMLQIMVLIFLEEIAYYIKKIRHLIVSLVKKLIHWAFIFSAKCIVVITILHANCKRVLKMYDNTIKEMNNEIIDMLNNEIENDSMFRKYIKSINEDIIKDVNKVFCSERIALYDMNKYIVWDITDKNIKQAIFLRLEKLFNKYNYLFNQKKYNRRIILYGDTIHIARVSEEIKDSAWNVIEPWGQKYCLSESYLHGLTIKEIEKEFNFYPRCEVISFLTGEPVKCIVFPKTTLAKILKVFSSFSIHRSIITNNENI